MNNKKLSKCVVVKGRNLLKKLKIDFEDSYVVRPSDYVKSKNNNKECKKNDK